MRIIRRAHFLLTQQQFDFLFPSLVSLWWSVQETMNWTPTCYLKYVLRSASNTFATFEWRTILQCCCQQRGRCKVGHWHLWGGSRKKSVFDVRVFNPFAPSNRQSLLSSVYTKHEKEKKRVYDQRVKNVELATFTSLVLSLNWWFGQGSNLLL